MPPAVAHPFPKPLYRRRIRDAAALAVLSFVLGLICPLARAQTITLRDGQTIPTQGVRREGETILVRIQTAEGNAGEAGYPVANIARLDFPDPPQLKTAAELLNGGKAADAVAQLAPILAYQAGFRDLPGNRWTPLALLQVDALTRVGRAHDADVLTADLLRSGAGNAELLRTVKLKQAVAIERRGDHKGALTALQPLVSDTSAQPDSLVEGWLAVGSARLALRNYQDALLAFLHVPVYAPDRALLMPSALLGSAKAYLGLGDEARAQTTLKTLLADYPNSPEATEAKERLQTLLDHPHSTPGG